MDADGAANGERRGAGRNGQSSISLDVYFVFITKMLIYWRRRSHAGDAAELRAISHRITISTFQYNGSGHSFISFNIDWDRTISIPTEQSWRIMHDSLCKALSNRNKAMNE